MELDARATTHPIQQAVASESAGDDAFDQITYQKASRSSACSKNWLGCRLLRRHSRVHEAARVSSTPPLSWKALEEVSGKTVRKSRGVD